MLRAASASASDTSSINDSTPDDLPFSHKCASHRHAGHFLLVTAGRSCWALPSLLRHAQVHARATSNGRDGTQMGQGPAGLASRPWRSQQPVRRRTIWRACCGRHPTRSSSRRRPPRILICDTYAADARLCMPGIGLAEEAEGSPARGEASSLARAAHAEACAAPAEGWRRR